MNKATIIAALGVAVLVVTTVVGATRHIVKTHETLKSDIEALAKKLNGLDEKENPGEPKPPTLGNAPGSQEESELTSGLAVILGATKGETACGMKFGPEDEFAAHHTIPCGSEILVTNLTKNKSISLRITERAGTSATWKNIKLAVSKAAAEKLEISGRGFIQFNVTNIP